MAKTDDINKPAAPTPEPTPATDTAPVETSDEATTTTDERAPGFHVMHNGQSLGCYPTKDDAVAFATGHLAPQALTYAVEEVSA